MSTTRLKLLKKLQQEFERQGESVQVVGDSICLGRIRFDPYTQQPTLMMSAAMYIQPKLGEVKFHVFVTEQYDAEQSLKRYSITLCDHDKMPMVSYDRDPKRGDHFHGYTDGEKIRTHVPFTGTMADIVKDTLRRIAKY
jgi:hypothetical protein